MTLPFGTDLARGTLRALARRQGTRDDVEAAEEPGKILHEVRRTTFEDPGIFDLPPTYYGTVDATPLWVCLLHDAWRWGLPAGRRRRAAPRPRRRPGLDAPVGRGSRRRAASATTTPPARGLEQPGLEGLRRRDAHADGADRDGPDRPRRDPGVCRRGRPGCRRPARGRVRRGRHAVAALGRASSPSGCATASGSPGRTAAATSRWPSTGRGASSTAWAATWATCSAPGCSTTVETAAVAAALGSPDMLGPLGMRTLSSSNPAYNPLGYHTGLGLDPRHRHLRARPGPRRHPAEAARWRRPRRRRRGERLPVARAVRRRARCGGAPAPYPASCRPQAWAAASAGLLVSTVLGLRADAPNRRLELSALPRRPFGALRVEGVRVGGRAGHRRGRRDREGGRRRGPRRRRGRGPRGPLTPGVSVPGVGRGRRIRRRRRTVRAVVWNGKRTCGSRRFPDPVIQEPGDAVVRVTSTNICGSDLHLYEPLGAFMDAGGRARARGDGRRRGGRREVTAIAPATASSSRSRSAAAPAGCASTACRASARPRRSVNRAPVQRCSATPSSTAPCRVVRRSTCACHRRSTRTSRCPTGRRTSGSSTSRTCCRRPGRRWRTPIPSRRAPCSCSASARSVTWRAGSRCSAESGRSSGSTGSTPGSSGPAAAGSRRSTCARSMTTSRRPCAS